MTPTTEAVISKLLNALEGVAVDCDPASVADALLWIALSAAERTKTKTAIARALMGIAEGYMWSDAPASPTAPSAWSHMAHTALTASVAAMQSTGMPPAEARLMLLNFGAAWMANDDPCAGAEVLYSLADLLVGKTSKLN